MKVGIIAGDGRLPVAFAAEAKKIGYTVIGIGVIPEVDHELAAIVDTYYQIPVGHWGKIVATLKKEKISEVYLLGKVEKGLMYTDMDCDERFQSVVASLRLRNDDSVAMGFVQDLAKEGIHVAKQTELITRMLAPEGVLVGEVTEKDWTDIRFGYRMAKGIAGLDIGQTVVVKDAAVIAVEAIEGTDQAILRGGQLVGPGTVVVKVAKPQQDLRFDIPTVGLRTLKVMKEVGARLLAIEAGAVFIVDREELTRQAGLAGIAIVGVSE